MPSASTYRGRRAFTLDNRDLRVTVLCEGGHIAEIFDKRHESAVDARLAVDRAIDDDPTHSEYGGGVDARCSRASGHNLCLDISVPCRPKRPRRARSVHGEASVIRTRSTQTRGVVMRATLPRADLRVERRLDLHGRAL